MSINDCGDRHPVVLVHGILDTKKVFNKMSNYLKKEGWNEVYALNLKPNYGVVSLTVLAQQVKTFIDDNFAQNQKINLIGFSMGGIVTRYYLQKLGGIEKVVRYISISAPNNGTFLAYFLPFQGIVEMRFKSQLLNSLNQEINQVFNNINVTIIYTPFDLMIIPSHSSKMNFNNHEFKIPVLIHRWMLKDERVLTQIKDSLLKPIKNN